jgi:hypothetical protein
VQKKICIKIQFYGRHLKKLRQVNPNKEPLTPELLKKFSGFENLSEEKLQEFVFSIQTLCELGYELFQQIQSQVSKKSGAAILLRRIAVFLFQFHSGLFHDPVGGGFNYFIPIGFIKYPK